MKFKILKKNRLISTSGFLASGLLNNEAMEKNQSNENISKKEILKKFIICNNYPIKISKDVKDTNFKSSKIKYFKQIILDNIKLDESKYYDFFSNIYAEKLDIRNLFLENIKFNYFLNNSIIDEIIISKKNYVKQKLDYYNNNLSVATKINKITIHINNNTFNYVNESNENYDFLLKIILNNIDKIKDNDSFETINSKFIKIKNKIIEERKKFIDEVNEKKKFIIIKDNNIYYKSIYYSYILGNNTICKFEYKDFSCEENLPCIYIDDVETAGYYSGCGLFKGLISEIYKKKGLITICLNEPTTIGREVYRKLGFIYNDPVNFLNGCPILGKNPKKKLLDSVNNDYRVLNYLLDNKSDFPRSFCEMSLLPIEENIKNTFFKNKEELFEKISKINKIDLNIYNNDENVIYKYYWEFLNSNVKIKNIIANVIKQTFNNLIKEKNLKIEKNNYLNELFKNDYINRFAILHIIKLILLNKAFTTIFNYSK